MSMELGFSEYKDNVFYPIDKTNEYTDQLKSVNTSEEDETQQTVTHQLTNENISLSYSKKA